MNTLQEDAVNNFILDLLPPSTNNISEIKQKCITQLKRRIIRVDAIQRHCINLNSQLSNKEKELEETTKKLEYTQQDYKQTSLEYQEILESSTKHEKENEELRATLEKLEREHLMVVTQLEARQSHIVQLEQLVKQQERKIEYVEQNDPKKIEKIIEVKISAAIKEKEKERLLWKRKYESLQKKMKDKESKKKLIIAQVQKYDKHGNDNNSDSLSFDGHSDTEDNTSVELMAQLVDKKICQNTTHLAKACPITPKEHVVGTLEDFCNEIVSIDTGCGSSLASSDNEKWLNSPDYLFSPIYGDNNENNRGRKLVHVATSPIIFNKGNTIGTSPIPSVNMIDVGTDPILLIRMTEFATSPIPTQCETETSVIITDRAVTPNKSFMLRSGSVSPLNNTTNENIIAKNVEENASTAHSSVILLENACNTDIQDSTVNVNTCADSIVVNNNVDSTITVPKPAKVLEDTTAIDVQESLKIDMIPILENSTDPCPQEIANVTQDIVTKVENRIDKIVPVNQIQERQEKELLNLNDSNKMDVDNDDDLDNEIEMILNTMRFNRKLVTPIPRTPGRTMCQSASTKSLDILADEVTHAFCQEAAIARDQAAAAKEEAASAREYTVKLKQEQLKLMAYLKKIEKDMTNIKTFLKKRLLLPGDGDSEENDLLPKFGNNFSSDQRYIYKELQDGLPSRDNDCKSSKLQNKSLLSDNNITAGELQDPLLRLNSDTNLGQLQDQTPVLWNNTISEELDDNFTLENNSKSILPNPGNNLKPEKIQDSLPSIDCKLNKLQNQSLLLDNNITLGLLQDPSRLGSNTNPRLLEDQTPVLCSNSISEELRDSLPSLDCNIKKLQNHSLTFNNNITSGLSQDPSSKLANDTKSGQLQDQSSHLGISAKCKPNQMQEESVYNSNVNVLQSHSAQARDNVITVISETILKPEDLENVKNKEDWVKLVQKSGQNRQFEIGNCQLDSPKKEDNIYLHTENNSSTSSDIKEKRQKGRKLSNLDRYRKKCERPKYKIKRESPLIKPCNKSKQLVVCSKQLKALDTSATLNDKNVYENAVKVMAQLNAKTSKSSIKLTAADVEDVKQTESDAISLTCNAISPKSRMKSANMYKQTENTLQAIAETTPTKLGILYPTPVPKSAIMTRSRKMSGHDIFSSESVLNSTTNSSTATLPEKNHIRKDSPSPNTKRKRKLCDDSSDTTPKRVLRNSPRIKTEEHKFDSEILQHAPSPQKETDIFGDGEPAESVLCVMIQKYGLTSKKHRSRNVNDADTRIVCEIINMFMSETNKITSKQNRDELVEELRNYNCKDFLSGLMQYLNDADRKCELFSKMSIPAQIEITKSEAVLMYVIKQLRNNWHPVNLVAAVLSNIEYTIFRLNKTPSFDVVDVMAHFYAVLCRLNDDRDRLITFMLDAMYCIQYKSIGLIKQCLEAWPHIIPLAHMSKAKTPLMTSFVYLLHFFKCEDKYNTVQGIRNILHRKYYYEATQWNEKKILELLKCSIRELAENEHDKKMLRIALIVFGKRHGPEWTHTHIIKNILLPFIEREKVSNHLKAFCLEMLGPLLKPYPLEMKMHCDLALDRLMAILKTAKSKDIADAAMSSIVLLSRHNFDRVAEILLSRKMDSLSPQLEELIRDYVRTKCDLIRFNDYHVYDDKQPNVLSLN